MTELKTLKDITPIFVSEDNIGDVLISSAKLKEEAIKWIKFLKANNNESLCLECKKPFGVCHDFEDTGNKPCGKAIYGENCLSDADYESSDSAGAITILKYFFNITDGDLK